MDYELSKQMGNINQAADILTEFNHKSDPFIDDEIQRIFAGVISNPMDQKCLSNSSTA